MTNFPSRGFYRGDKAALLNDVKRAFDEQDQIPQPLIDRSETESKVRSAPSPRTSETLTQRETARASGYTGDQCSNCNSMRMKISGHCMVCEDCGTTTGCS
jgi:ribonucleoside-diphosphate reductase alpha chain